MASAANLDKHRDIINGNSKLTVLESDSGGQGDDDESRTKERTHVSEDGKTPGFDTMPSTTSRGRFTVSTCIIHTKEVRMIR